MVGVIEAGKSNLLLALWKLNPATGGETNKLDDISRTIYSEWRKLDNQPAFITDELELSNPDLIKGIFELAGSIEEDIQLVKAKRKFSGTRIISFPTFQEENTFSSQEIIKILDEHK